MKPSTQGSKEIDAKVAAERERIAKIIEQEAANEKPLVAAKLRRIANRIRSGKSG